MITTSAAPSIRTDAGSAGCLQTLWVLLDGVTAGDYLTWIREPEPWALGRELRSVSAEASPVADRLKLELVWDRHPPGPRIALAAAGFAAIPEVAAVLDLNADRITDRRSGWRSC